MKFFCEYCGNRIDAEKDNKCPNCGASYKKNKSFIKKEEEIKKQSELNKENKQKIFNHVLGALKFSKWFLLIPAVIFVVILIIIISTFGNFGKIIKSQIDNNKQTEIKDNVQSIFDSKKEEDVVVDFDEYAQTSKYKVKVNKYEVVEDKFNRLDDDYEYVKFHLLVENLTDKELTKEDVNCIVDGIAQTNDFTSGYSDLPMFISKGLTVKGTATFEVPKDATSYDIKYGDYITIHIEK